MLLPVLDKKNQEFLENEKLLEQELKKLDIEIQKNMNQQLPENLPPLLKTGFLILCPCLGMIPILIKNLLKYWMKNLEKGHWEDTLLLQVTGKKLREFREHLINRLELPSNVQNLEPTRNAYSHPSKQQNNQNHLVFSCFTALKEVT